MKSIPSNIALFVVVLVMISCGHSNSPTELKLIPVLSGKEYQYVDANGKVLINPQFGEATVFRDGLALVKTSGENPKWGFIDEKGKYVNSPVYTTACAYSEGLAWVVEENCAPKAINTKGEIKINLQIAQSVRSFSQGLAAFKITGDETKWGFIDYTGKIAITPQFIYVGDFHEGKCAFKNSNQKWGYIDKEGKIFINPQFDKASGFHNGQAVVYSGNKAGVVDEKGKYIINPQFEEVVYDEGVFLVEQDSKWGWCDNNGKIIINPQFKNAFPFLGSNLAAVSTDKNWGYIDKEGKIVVNPQFDFALPFSGKYAVVSSGSKIGFIDRDGKYSINPQFDGINSDLAVFLLNGSSNYDEVETDYFTDALILEKVKSNITDKSFEGLTFSTPISDILKKYNKSELDFSKYSNQNAVITNVKIDKDVSYDFYVLGNPWLGNYYSYEFNSKFNPSGYAYIIHLQGKPLKKEDDIFANVQRIFSDYTKDSEKSTANSVTYKNSNQTIVVAKNNGDIVMVSQPLAPTTRI